MQLTTFDFVLLAGYFAIVLFVGWRAGRRGDTERFLLASRELGPWESAASMCASKTGAGFFLTQVALVYVYGAAAVWTFLGVLVGYIGFYFFAARIKPRADRDRYYTLSDYFFQEFGSGAGYASACMVLAIFSLGFASQLIGGAKVMAALTGFDYVLSLLLMASVIVIYILVGGFKAVVATDVVQYVAILTLSLVLAAFLFLNLDIPIPTEDLTFAPSVSAALFIASVLFPFAAADLWQRVYATRGRAQTQRSLLYAMFIYTLFGFLLTAVGLLVKSVVHTDDHNLALIIGFQQLLPAGLMGLAVIVLYAALMSSADTNLFTSSSVVVQDLYGRLVGEVSHDQMVVGIRWVSVVFGVVAFVLAALFADLLKVGFVWFALNVSVGVVVLASWLLPGVTSVGLTTGLITAAAALIVRGSVWSTDEILIYVALIATSAGILSGELLGRLWSYARVDRGAQG